MKSRLVLGIIFGIAWASSAAYIWVELGDRGAYADASGTGGYTTGFDLALMAFAAVCFIISVAFFIQANKRK